MAVNFVLLTYGADADAALIVTTVIHVMPAIVASTILFWISVEPTRELLMLVGACVSLLSTILYAVMLASDTNAPALYLCVACAMLTLLSWALWVITVRNQDHNLRTPHVTKKSQDFGSDFSLGNPSTGHDQRSES